jgi:sulfatase modifying factor 1
MKMILFLLLCAITVYSAEKEKDIVKIPIKINQTDGAEMVYVQAGKFMMGTDAKDITAMLEKNKEWKAKWFATEGPKHEVELSGYWVYKYEVTVAQYKKFCAVTKRKMPKLFPWVTDNHPIINVTWEDADDYARWAKAKLPTEAQWEKAARGTDGRIYPWGNDWANDNCNNYGSKYQIKPNDEKNKENKTTVVGKCPQSASQYGAQDMAGNAWEWCRDWYDADYYKTSPAKNPQGPDDGEMKVMRGGSWGSYAISVRCANRHSDLPDLTYVDSGGFRCVVED